MVYTVDLDEEQKEQDIPDDQEEDKGTKKSKSVPDQLEEQLEAESKPEDLEVPTEEPKVEPPEEPKVEPTEEPKVEPPEEPKVEPTEEPKVEPPEEPKVEPTEEPKVEPTEEPKIEPTEEPKVEPTEEPKVEPTEEPKAKAKKVKKDKDETKEEKPEEPKKEKKPKNTRVKKEEMKKLLFKKYDFSEVEIADEGLKRYINIEPIILPHVSARYANKKFGKSKVNIVERLINNLMRTERFTGKKFKTYNVVKDSFDIIEKRTKTNPVQILIQALENGAPKEEIVRLRFGGILVPKAVDSSPSRRLDISIRNICKGAVKSSHKNRKDAAVCLAEELIFASKRDMNSFAVNKKEDIERVAASAR